MAKGIIYITITSVTGLIKIGKTRTDQFENRMTALEQNGYWNVSGLKRFFAVEVEDYDEKEKLLHTIFSKSQVDKSELFALNKDLAKEILESFGGKQIYPKIEEKPIPHKIPRAKNLTFEMIEIPVGSELVFKENPTITVKTYDNKNKIIYNKEIYSISKVVSIIKGDNLDYYQGGYHFTFNGELLTDRRARFEEMGKL